MMPLRRHQLAYLTTRGWTVALNQSWDDVERDCLHHWAKGRLPLVVTRQAALAADADAAIALGLSAPAAWQRRRIALQLPRSCIAWFDEFPDAHRVLRMLCPRLRSAVQKLLMALEQCDIRTRIYGSYGWQIVSGHEYLHRGSDLDLWMSVDGSFEADAAAHLLHEVELLRLRIDGELMFLDGAAVAWREWLAWRAGQTRGLLVKRLDSVAVEESPMVCETDSPRATVELAQHAPAATLARAA